MWDVGCGMWDGGCFKAEVTDNKCGYILEEQIMNNLILS